MARDRLMKAQLEQGRRALPQRKGKQRRDISTGLASSQRSSRKATLNPSRKATETRTVHEIKAQAARQAMAAPGEKAPQRKEESVHVCALRRSNW